jgi:hypothetical protein
MQRAEEHVTYAEKCPILQAPNGSQRAAARVGTAVAAATESATQANTRVRRDW